MSRLNTQINDVTKQPDVQLSQLAQYGQDTVNWSNNILTQTLVNYTETPNLPANESTTSTAYVALKNFTQNFTPNNPLCFVNLHLCLQGEGNIGIFINGLLSTSIYFNNTTFAPTTYSQPLTFGTGSTKISIQWKAKTGTVAKGNTAANDGLNSLQITSTNS